MKHADPERLAEQTAETGAESLMVYAMASSGIALYNSKFAPKFKNLPDNFLGDFLEACRKRKHQDGALPLAWQPEDLDIRSSRLGRDGRAR